MFTVEQSVIINRPVEDVFAYVTTPSNIPKWRPDVLEINGANGSVAVGASAGRPWRLSRARATM